MCVWQVFADLGMDLGMVVKNEASDRESLSSVNASLLTSAALDSKSCPTLSTAPVSAALDNNPPASLASSTADRVVDASSALSMGLLPKSFISAQPKISDSAGPFKLAIPANSLRSVVPKTSAQVTSSVIGLSQPPTLLVGPAVTAPGCTASPRKTVTVIPAGMRSPSQGPLAVIRPVAPAGQMVNFATRSPGKVTVLSLPKTSSVPAQFVTVVPSTGSGTAMSTSGLNNKTTAIPYKVLIRPSPAAVSIYFFLCVVDWLSLYNNE